MKRFCTLSYVFLILIFGTLIFLPHTFAQRAAPENMVKLVYFLPNDRSVRPERVEALRQLIKDAQQFYAEQMESHGYGRKTFNIETDANGTPIVHRIDGKFNENHYYTGTSDFKIWEEMYEHFEDLQHIYLIAIDLSQETLNDGDSCGLGGIGFLPMGGEPWGLFGGKFSIRHRHETSGEEALGGSAIIPASGHCFEDNRGYLHPLRATTHELGHAFGLDHDFRDADAVVGGRGYRLSECAAEWLSVHRFFNTKPIGKNQRGSVSLLGLRASERSEIHLRFQVNDPNGLHQAQLLVPEDGSWGPLMLVDCQKLDGQTQTVEFVTTELAATPPDRVVLQFMDDLGNITWATIQVDIASLLPRPKVVSIPDRNLAAAVRKTLGLTSNTQITDQAMQKLTRLEATESQIKDLTGLEQASQLTELRLNKNQIRDINPLSRLTHLKFLVLNQNQIRNIRPLTGLTQLEGLFIGGNEINNQGIQLLTNLTGLKWLALYGNQIRNITPLANLTKLKSLWLDGNQIRDVTPLAELVNLETLHLKGNPIQDTSPLANLPNLRDVDFAIAPRLSIKREDDSDEVVPTPAVNLSAAGPKIEGPWLWMIIPTGRNGGKAAAASGKDYLSVATKGSVTEVQIATNGVTVGDRVKNRKWTMGQLAPTGGDNIMETLNAIGFSKNTNVDNHVAYGLITLDSPRKQNTTMYVGSDDAVKVWLNGELVHDNPIDRGASDYQESFPVPLKQGKNILLVAVYEAREAWTGFFGFEKDAAYSIPTTPVVQISSTQRPPLYWINAQAGTIHRLVSAEVENLVPGVQNATSLVLNSADNKIYWTEQTAKNRGSIKRANLDGSNVQILATLQSAPTSIAIDIATGKLYWTSSNGQIKRANLNGRQIRNLIKNLKSPDKLIVDAAGGKLYWTETSGRIRRANLNGKGIENIASGLSPVADIAISGNKLYWTEITSESSGKIGRANLNGSNFGTLTRLQTPALGVAIDAVGNKLYWSDTAGRIRRANLNGKQIQNVVSGLASPAALVIGSVRSGPAAPVNSSQTSAQREIPDATRLLANYPNPFNPETWIPYQLTVPSDVQITIYDARGTVVRRMELGHQSPGTYTSQSRAAHWDGRNTQGERVASGIYFYQFQADNVSLLRKMLILK